MGFYKVPLALEGGHVISYGGRAYGDGKLADHAPRSHGLVGPDVFFDYNLEHQRLPILVHFSASLGLKREDDNIIVLALNGRECYILREIPLSVKNLWPAF